MKLHFVKSSTVLKTYSQYDVLKKIHANVMIMNFKHHMRNTSKDYKSYEDRKKKYRKLNGGISNKINQFKYIAFMDIDFKDFKDEIVEQLNELDIAHTVIESSFDRYWIIADKFKINRVSLAEYLLQFSGIDPKFLECSKSQGFNLRAYPKDGFIPQVISESGSGSKAYIEFMDEWNKYWKLPHIKWMVQEYTVNMI